MSCKTKEKIEQNYTGNINDWIHILNGNSSLECYYIDFIDGKIELRKLVIFLRSFKSSKWFSLDLTCDMFTTEDQAFK
jgi:hypothetical protein